MSSLCFRAGVQQMRARCSWKAGFIQTPLLLWMPAQLWDPSLAMHLRVITNLASGLLKLL